MTKVHRSYSRTTNLACCFPAHQRGVIRHSKRMKKLCVRKLLTAGQTCCRCPPHSPIAEHKPTYQDLLRLLSEDSLQLSAVRANEVANQSCRVAFGRPFHEQREHKPVWLGALQPPALSESEMSEDDLYVFAEYRFLHRSVPCPYCQSLPRRQFQTIPHEQFQDCSLPQQSVRVKQFRNSKRFSLKREEPAYSEAWWHERVLVCRLLRWRAQQRDPHWPNGCFRRQAEGWHTAAGRESCSG
jgi:hypothetical protein